MASTYFSWIGCTWLCCPPQDLLGTGVGWGQGKGCCRGNVFQITYVNLRLFYTSLLGIFIYLCGIFTFLLGLEPS